jgi:CRISPR system Cascade subunit CasA
MTQTNETFPSFNLWTEAWITLEGQDGALSQHGIGETLLRAHEYVAIYDPSPLVMVGVHRLLTAILQDALNPQENADLEALWERGRFPAEAIERFRAQYANRFDLFSSDKPFYQSYDLPMVPQKKDRMDSVAKLFQDLPSGYFLTHYRHITEDEHSFSFATAAAGLVAIAPFASVGGAGNMPSINGVPPIYVLPAGKTLFEALAASLITRQTLVDSHPTRKGDLAWWKRPVPVIVETSKKPNPKKGIGIAESKQLSEVGYLHGLTFPARKVRLHPKRVDTACTRSGQPCEWGVASMAFQMGESKLEDAPVWTDPFAAYKLPAAPKDTGKNKGMKPGKKTEAKKPLRPMRGRAAWREFSGLFLQGSTAEKQTQRPLFLDQLAKLQIGKRYEAYPFRCIALQTDGKMKFFEWADFGFDVPPALLNDPQGAYWTEQAMGFAEQCKKAITSVFSWEFGKVKKKGDEKHERFKRLKARMEENYWAALAGEFRQFVLKLGNRSAQPQTLQSWLDTAKRIAQKTFDAAADATGDDGSALRDIVQGKAECARRLNILRSKNR